MSSVVAVVAALTIAAVFILSITGKLRHGWQSVARFATSMTVTLGLSRRAAIAGAIAVLVSETAVVGLLAVGVWRPGLMRAGLVLAAVLLAVFSGAIAIMLRRGVSESCHCFGASTRPVSRADLIRNAALLLAAVAGLSTVPHDVWSSVSFDPDDTTAVWAALAVLAVLMLVNVVLTARLTRQVARQNELLNDNFAGVEGPTSTMLEPGAVVGEFAAVTREGQRVSKADLTGDTLIGFLSATCPACAEVMPAYMLRAMDEPARVLTVVAGSNGETHHMESELARVSQVIVEPEHGAVATAFGVSGYPAFGLLSDDTVVASHFVIANVVRPE